MNTLRYFIYTILVIVVVKQTVMAEQVTIQANDDLIIERVVRNPLTINTLTENDETVGAQIFIYAASKPSFGSVEVRPGNVLVYTPSYSKFRGEDTFTYVISSEPNGAGVVSEARVTIRNPYYIYSGTFSGAIVGEHGTHGESGYFSMKVAPLGSFTAKLQFAGYSHSFKGEFDSEGHYTASIARNFPLPTLTLDIQFPLNGSSDINCELTNGAQVTSFVVERCNWSKLNPPPVKGRYTFALPAPNAFPRTPQGNGYGILTVSVDGTVSISGHTGDNRGFTSSSKLSDESIAPLYASLYSNSGSIFGNVTLNKVAPDRATLSANLNWSKPSTPKSKFFPKGFFLNVAGRGGSYIEPAPNSGVLTTTATQSFNSSFTVSSGVFRVPKTERAFLGNRPDSGKYVMLFDNTKRLKASLTVSPRTGLFSGYFFDVRTQKKYNMGGAFLQGENTAIGLWSSSTRTGKVVVLPDSVPDAIE